MYSVCVRRGVVCLERTFGANSAPKAEDTDILSAVCIRSAMSQGSLHIHGAQYSVFRFLRRRGRLNTFQVYNLVNYISIALRALTQAQTHSAPCQQAPIAQR